MRNAARRGSAWIFLATWSRVPSSLTKRLPLSSTSTPPTPRRASGARNFILAFSLPAVTKPVGWTWIMGMSTRPPPSASPSASPEPCVSGQLVVGRSSAPRAGFTEATSLALAPKPPVASTTASAASPDSCRGGAVPAAAGPGHQGRGEGWEGRGRGRRRIGPCSCGQQRSQSRQCRPRR